MGTAGEAERKTVNKKKKKTQEGHIELLLRWREIFISKRQPRKTTTTKNPDRLLFCSALWPTSMGVCEINTSLLPFVEPDVIKWQRRGKKNAHTCLPEDETVESHSHGPHVQRLQESCHKEHLMWHDGKWAEKTYIAEIRIQTTLTRVGEDGPTPMIYGTFFFKACFFWTVWYARDGWVRSGGGLLSSHQPLPSCANSSLSNPFLLLDRCEMMKLALVTRVIYLNVADISYRALSCMTATALMQYWDRELRGVKATYEFQIWNMSLLSTTNAPMAVRDRLWALRVRS